MDALLAEVHQLRLAIESMTGASQRVQIALYSLQLQDGATARAAQRLAEIHDKCSAKEADRAHVAADAQRAESATTSVDRQTQEAMDVVAHFQRELEVRTAELQSCQAAEAEASNLFRNEQGKLTELQDRITRLDAALAKLGAEGR